MVSARAGCLLLDDDNPSRPISWYLLRYKIEASLAQIDELVRSERILLAILGSGIWLLDGIGSLHAFSPSVPFSNALVHPSSSSTRLQAGFFEDLLAKKSTTTRPKVQVPSDFVVPEPRPLAISEGTDLRDFVKSTLSFAARLGTGAFTLGWKIDSIFYGDQETYSLKLGPFAIRDSSSVLDQAPRPKKPLILYQYDGSPFCKRVRETINLLDLTVEYRPCPGARQGKFSEELYERTGRRTVPYLIDPNTNQELFESGDQIEYLLQTYGPPAETFDRKALWPITFEAFSVTTSTIVAILRGFPGSKRQANARPDNEQMEPLELWGYESSPFVRPVREKLDALCLPHVMISCSRGSANRDRMVAKTGRFQVPFLVDPNTGLELFEGAEIVKYLDAVYTTAKSNP